MTDHSYLLDDEILPLHHHDDDRKDAIAVPGPDGSLTVHTGAGAQDRASRSATAPVADLVTELSENGIAGGCDEQRRSLTRRTTLRGALAATGAMLAPSVLPRYALSSAHAATRGTVIVVFMRGGADGLSILAPLGDPWYGRRRPAVALADAQTRPLTSMFGLNAVADPLMKYWDSGQLAFVHATGNTSPTRSHFEKQLLCESGAPVATASVRSGWLGRHLTTAGADQSTFRAFTMGGASAYALSSTLPTPAMASLGSFAVTSADGVQEQVTSDIREMWAAAGGPAEAAATRTLDAARQATQAATKSGPPTVSGYGGSAFGQAMGEVARVLRAGVTPEVVCVDSYGWDTHVNMRQGDGRVLPYVLKDFASTLDAFVTDIGPEAMSRTTIVAMTEFGRTADQNTSGGTDHGFGSTMIALGAGVRGGRVLGRHPGLTASALNGGALAIATDYRDGLAELVSQRLGNGANLATVFPGYTPKPLGLFTAA
ncbi:DUF1501 domain-containing protein [Phycicoccus avicenniae]|uniref:DUF1501 domain-containing protein n=1 Tax=Phycicoccus avicenniae TaxID=2828860 RepID=UPI003D27124B